MKHLFASLLTVVCFATHAQFPSLPYNPDENGDMLIGVVDLQALLANYGLEFASAVLSEDGESAIVFMGAMGYFECEYSCNQLPGFWSLPSGVDLVPVFSDLNTNYTYTWLSMTDFIEFPYNRAPYYQGANGISNREVVGTVDVGNNYRCYCAAKQLPRVEYSYCMTTGSTYNYLDYQGSAAVLFQSCCDDKVENGWYPVGGISKGSTSDGAQAFWRWAE